MRINTHLHLGLTEAFFLSVSMDIESVFSALSCVKEDSVFPVFEFSQYIQKLCDHPENYKGVLLIQDGSLHDGNWSNIGKILKEDTCEEEYYIKYFKDNERGGEALFATRLSNGWVNSQIYVLLHVKPVIGLTRLNLFIFNEFSRFYKFIEKYSKNNNMLAENEINSFLSNHIFDVVNYMRNFEFIIHVRE